MQIPSGRAAQSENFFHTTLNNFYEYNDEAGHTLFLTELCRAFTGIPFNQSVDSMDISNGVFSYTIMSDFIRNVEASHLSDQKWLTPSEDEVISLLMTKLSQGNVHQVLSTAITSWIHPEEPEHTIEHLEYAMTVFSNLVELIQVCSKINNHHLYTMEGGASC